MIDRRIKHRTDEGFKYFETEWYLNIKQENEKFINRVSVTLILFAVLIMMSLVIYNIIFEDGKLFWNYMISGILMSLLLIAVLKIKDRNIKSNIILLTGIAGFIGTQILPGEKEMDMLIFLIFPIIAVQINGVKRGSIWTYAFWLIALVASLIYNNKIWVDMYNDIYKGNTIWAIIISIMIYLITVYWEKQHESFFDKMVENIIYDEKTSLPNRKVLLETISDIKESVVVIVKIENFDELTSVFGYELSDNITTFAGESLKSGENLYGYKTFYLKEDEFALYFSDNHVEEEELINNMETLLKELHYGKMVWRYMDIRLSYRMGVSVIREGEKRSALSNADIAIKTGRVNGNRISIFKNHVSEKKKAINAMLRFNELSENKENRSFKAVFQPIIDTKTKEIVWYEALMRIKNKNGEYETVYNYLEIAKTTGFYENISIFMLEEACKAVLKTGKNVSVNLSVNDALNKKFYDRIKSASDIIKNSTGRIIIEILESEEIYEIEKCIEFLEYAKSLEYIIAIDDFGTGYSNFSNLIKLPVDIIKIDGEIIRNMSVNNSAVTIVEGILTFCKNSNKKSVAEFVENEEIYKIVKKLGVDFSQGYYIGKPDDIA